MGPPHQQLRAHTLMVCAERTHFVVGSTSLKNVHNLLHWPPEPHLPWISIVVEKDVVQIEKYKNTTTNIMYVTLLKKFVIYCATLHKLIFMTSNFLISTVIHDAA